jgi:hypothetical protein
MSSFLGPLGLGRDSSGVYIAFPTARVGVTAEGGFAVKKTNKTGGASVKGTLVQADAYGTENAFTVSAVDAVNPIGIVYENDIPDGGACWIVIHGSVEVLLKNGTSATAGNWVKSSDVEGRIDASNAAPPGGGIPEIDEHFTEVGHCLQDVTSGTDKLALILMHFN